MQLNDKARSVLTYTSSKDKYKKICKLKSTKRYGTH